MSLVNFSDDKINTRYCNCIASLLFISDEILLYDTQYYFKTVSYNVTIIFQKAIMESDEEWTMNKKLIDLSSKDVRKCVRIETFFLVTPGLSFLHFIYVENFIPNYLYNMLATFNVLRRWE